MKTNRETRRSDTTHKHVCTECGAERECSVRRYHHSHWPWETCRACLGMAFARISTSAVDVLAILHADVMT